MPKLSKKAAVDLSINMLVIIIISLVVLGAGITLLYKFIGSAESVKKDIDQRTEEELENLITNQGKQVALAFPVAEIERGSNHVFGIGILNIKDKENEFTLTVQLSRIIDEQKKEVPLTTSAKTEAESWLLYNQEPILLQENQHHKESIAVVLPKQAPKGQYIFSVYVYTADKKQYGNTQKFYVTVT